MKMRPTIQLDKMGLYLFHEPSPKLPRPVSMFCSVRMLIALLSMMGTSIMYITRVNLNIAILAMVKTEIPIQLSNQTTVDLNSSMLQLSTSMISPIPSPPPVTSGEFEWSPPEQGIILGSFFYGYISTQIMGGRLAETYLSPAKLIFLALSMSGTINLFTPFMARHSTPLFVFSRMVLGAFQGLIYPAFYCLFSKWIPSNERSTFIPWLDAGSTTGTVLTSVSAGQIIVWFAQIGGWPVVFYFSSTLALLWSLLWILFVRSNPEHHPLINKEELSLLLNDQRSQSSDTATVSPCWRNILTSRAFLAVLIVKMCYGFVFDFVCQKIPAYLQDVIQLPVNETGLSFAVVMTGYMVALLSGGAIADTIITNTTATKIRVRKSFQLMSTLIMTVSLIAIPLACNSKWTTIALLTTTMIGYGFTSGGDLPLTADISGQISGTVFATMNTLCSISGFTVPYLVGVVIQPDPKSIHLWRQLFFTGAFLLILGTSVFVWLASADLQTDWIATSGGSSLSNSFQNRKFAIEYSESVNIVNKFKYHIPTYDTFTI